MNLKKMWKRFWNLNVHNHEGFTLVELIIVIAILAILSSVAVVGYSSYVTKANVQADKTLIAEIENVLTLAYYNGDIGANDSVSIILSTNGVVNADELDYTDTAKVLDDAYGSDWPITLKLQYAGWDLSVAADANLMSYVHSSGQFGIDGIEPLLGTVEHVTAQFSEWMKGGNVAPGTELAPYFEAAGIDYKSNPQAAANATVMFVGSKIANCGLTEQMFVEAWARGAFESISDDVVTQKAVEYAAALAEIKYIEKAAGITDGRYSNQLTSAEGDALVSKHMEVFQQMENDIPNYSQYYDGYVWLENGSVSTACPIYQDAMAFYAYMSGMTSVSDSLLQSSDISNSGFFNTGIEGVDSFVSKAVQDYVKLSEDLKAAGITNGVVISISSGVVTHMGAVKD